MNAILRQTNWKEKAAYGLFWSWNMIFLAFLVLGFAPRLLPELINSVQTGVTPIIYLVDGVVLSLVPVGVVLLGLTILRRAPARQFALGYVVEGPLMLLLIVRFFVVRQATPALTALMVIAMLGMAGFLWDVLDAQIERRSRWLNLIRLVGLTLMLLTSLYASVWIAFYAVPMMIEFFKWLGYTLLHLGNFFRDLYQFFRSLFTEGILWIPFGLLGIGLLLYTATLFVLTPIAVPVLSVRAWLRSFSFTAKIQGKVLPAAAVLLTIIITAVIFAVTNIQPQKQAFALLRNPPETPAEAQGLLAKSDVIRAGLLNAYLAPFRYISAMGEVTHIMDMYKFMLKLPEGNARQVEAVYETVARPLLYEPVTRQEPGGAQNTLALNREPAEAAQLYQKFFDEPIVDGERKEIVRAVTSTWSGSQAEAAWQAADDREVRLAEQEITIQEHGDWAEVELYEIYQNRTEQNQEVVYYFSLPESAVITGLWLGNSSDRADRYAFQVAPRGAAQAIYNSEKVQRRDPALLEQIGPRQYRLRAFPVPPLEVQWNPDRTRRISQIAPPLYLWMTYRTPAVDGTWPMPRLAYKNNIFWDAKTVRKLNGSAVKTDAVAWVPGSVIAKAVEPAAHRVDFPGGMSVVAEPVGQGSVQGLPAGVKLALVIDRSRSMEAHAQAVKDAVAQIQQAAPEADVYLTSSPFRGEQAALVSLRQSNAATFVYFGGQNPAELLAQFDSLRGERTYDGILVLSDGGAYELGESKLETPIPDAPVWMIHLGDELPLGYDDQTLELIQASGGGVAGSLDQALARLAADLAGRSAGAEMVDILDGYTWKVLPTGQAAQTAAAREDGFTALLARRLILAEIRRNRGTIADVATLDQLHALAKESGIVTPYSSMIVLVNERQEQALDRLEKQEDRFDREYEPLAGPPLVGVPEPEEWLLIGMGTVLLAWYVYRSRTARA